MGSISTHVIDTENGSPATNIAVTLEFHVGKGEWKELATGITGADGKIHPLLPKATPLSLGRYRITYATQSYFNTRDLSGFYPYVTVVFEISDTSRAHDLPLFLGTNGYSTFRVK